MDSNEIRELAKEVYANPYAYYDQAAKALNAMADLVEAATELPGIVPWHEYLDDPMDDLVNALTAIEEI